jgi:hypothetical protein
MVSPAKMADTNTSRRLASPRLYRISTPTKIIQPSTNDGIIIDNSVVVLIPLVCLLSHHDSLQSELRHLQMANSALHRSGIIRPSIPLCPIFIPKRTAFLVDTGVTSSYQIKDTSYALNTVVIARHRRFPV